MPFSESRLGAVNTASPVSTSVTESLPLMVLVELSSVSAPTLLPLIVAASLAPVIVAVMVSRLVPSLDVTVSVSVTF